MTINFENIPQILPFEIFMEKYQIAKESGQNNIEAISVSSYSPDTKEVNSRFVNLKYVKSDNLIFFSNYDSQKSKEFSMHEQVSVLIYWNKINTQIRIKGKITKTTEAFNKNYFANRNMKKNALAISSHQSKEIESFNLVKKNFEHALKNADLENCPRYWGGFSIKPYYFEFWEGSDFRLNKRTAFEINGENWKKIYLQP